MGVGTQKIISFMIEDWILLLLLTAIFGAYFYFTSTFDYFKDKGIPYMKPTIILGNLGPRIIHRKSFHDFQMDIYNYFKGNPFGGMFEGRRPILYLLDPALIKAVTIRDFDHFVDRFILDTKTPNYLDRSLLNLKGLEWKGVRSVLTPTFSSARLKNMLPIIEQCSERVVEYLNSYDNSQVELKDAMGHYTLEVIGSCAFGIKSDIFSDKNARFIKVAEKFNYMPVMKRMFILFILLVMPWLVKYTNITFLNLESTNEIIAILRATKRKRRELGSKEQDFLQLVLDAAEKEKKNSENEENHYLDDDTIDAQLFLFLIAGYETSSTLLSFALHTLAVKPEIQEKLKDHIEEVTNGKELTYEVLSQLTYLEAVLLETLRMYPPFSRVDRCCTKSYVIPGTSIKLEPGDSVSLPVIGLHMDPDIYPEPLEFRPERFLDKEKPPFFLGFGIGPRNCIGNRFAMISAKLVMVHLVKNFKFLSCSKTENPIVLHKRSLFLKSQNGIWVHVDKRESNY